MSTEDNITCKVVLVGETGVGKTSIIQRYLLNSFTEILPSTVTSSYSYKLLEYPKFKKSISFDIWDTAGQEQYRSVAKNFYINAAIAILVYDIRRRDSFEAIKEYWYDQLKESGEDDMVIAIAGNKSDLFEEEEVPEDEAKQYAQSVGAIFQLTSCKKNFGIDELFKICGQKYLENKKLIGIGNKMNDGKIKIDNNKNDDNNGDTGKKKKKRFY